MKWKLVNYFPGDNGKANCDICGTLHIHQYWLEDDDGISKEVGSECARKLLDISLSELNAQADEIAVQKKNRLHVQYNEQRTSVEIEGRARDVEKLQEQLEIEGFVEFKKGSTNGGRTFFLTMKIQQ
jgi:NMD protein affecting ribosome stability and mRNA decay